MIKHPVKTLLDAQADHQVCGLISVCSGNFLVIETAVEQAKRQNLTIIVEATANQVNQYGGYTGLTPGDFAERVYQIADQCQLDRRQLILGGDHLGPMVWKNEPSAQAMEKARELVKLYVEAGFTKIHLDTSMHLADDDADMKLPTELAAGRTAQLALAAEAAWEQVKDQSSRLTPVYVIGSEVPVAGGSTDHHAVSIPSPDTVDDMIRCFENTFISSGLADFWQQVIVMVVQAGVEFSPHDIIEYDHEKAQNLSDKMKACKDYLFECHSTDYQTQDALRQLVKDGLRILKVGPGLTFALREALFGLALIEDELIKAGTLRQASDFVNVLDDAMVKDPRHWQGHHHGSAEEMRLARLYSYADRCRYYMQVPGVEKAFDQLVRNLAGCEIPLYLISQFLPKQYEKIRNRQLDVHPVSMIKDAVSEVLQTYFTAAAGE